MRISRKLLVSFLLTPLLFFGQKPLKPSSSEIYESIKKLNFLGSVLYVAAHPDDENTTMISYFSNHVKAQTAYLAMTRGDGGQNLIGPELSELLGLIRTQELLAARKIDGGKQMFTLANDFGYSKHPDETLKFWSKSEELGDVVRAIRKFQPDVIINRFDHRSPGTTHGHHTSSAMLAFEAFDLANDPKAYPEQIKTFGLWQPKRLFFNTSWWFYGSRENFEKADKSKLMSMDLGTFYPSKGMSNPEISALSRSMHKSQGFGVTGSRGESIEYVEILKGSKPTNNNVFEGIDTSWNRVEGGKAIGEILKEVENEFDFKDPSKSIPRLMDAYLLINQLKNHHWKEIKLQEIKDIIAACSGLFLEVTANSETATRGETITISTEVINRSSAEISLAGLKHNGKSILAKPIQLSNNKRIEIKDSITIPIDQLWTAPYWLTEKHKLGRYKSENDAFIGEPETPVKPTLQFQMVIDGRPIEFERTVVYKFNDPVKGEVYQPFEVVPAISLKVSENVLIFNTKDSKEISINVTSHKPNISGDLSFDLNSNWTVAPSSIPLSFNEKNETKEIRVTITPPDKDSEVSFSPKFTSNGIVYSHQIIEIDYDHIPKQMAVMPIESKLVRMNLEIRGHNIGYIEGAGDAIPEALRNIGYNVVMVEPDEITPDNISHFDAIVMGVRAYNTVDQLETKQPILLDYVKNGGNLVVQYNTNSRLKTGQLAPYSLNISRDRVTEEDASVTMLHPENEILSSPNKITSKDFEGWIQERGLYFPNEWSKEFTPLLEMKDSSEKKVSDGALLVAKYGKGNYIYTGLSFFRELPAGVSGAYRLFANMLSVGHNQLNQEQTQLQD
ncbi:PIG-L family deacetylase [Aegicerativicinus sediminis]|uniref:PIG-L family deacetylase n=1 Tax=Aegicerativicinus sediminis TaxID=2893202 RepID=UPI001E5CE740|nr:PIG-L family deacetylase [Aegicerativicinus sediminis]